MFQAAASGADAYCIDFIMDRPIDERGGRRKTLCYAPLWGLNVVRPRMQFHDYHLEGYEVSRQGAEIVLHLVWNYPGTVRDDSRIAFNDVTLYNFAHTAGAIITDIVELPVSELVREFASQISEWNRMSGIDLWKDTLDNYISTLQQQEFRSWRIESAIGFRGFVIAKTIGEA